MFISFLSDYGLTDPFVGVCHGVIARIAPAARVIDLTHGVPRQDVRTGAVLLADSVLHLPVSVHLAVVDPGVGTARRGVAVRAADGSVLVGPDNGLLLPAVRRLGGIDGAWELADAAYRLSPVSRTFHGRDIFAPAAAHVAGGLDPGRLGPAVDDLVPLWLPEPGVAPGRVTTEVLTVDQFGNLQLGARPDDLEAAQLAGDVPLEIHCGDASVLALPARTFAESERGALVVLEDSSGRLAVAVNEGSAAAALHAGPGAALVIGRRRA